MNRKVKSTATDIAECALFVVLMIVSSYIQIPFPLVPLTFQTVTAVLCGLLLGWKKGVISMAVYCFTGLVGLPVFAAGGGIYYILKPSFGYILGFVFSALVAGLIINNKNASTKRCIIAAISAFLADYAVGIPYCMILAKCAGMQNLTGLFLTGNLVYMPKDFVLCVLAAFLAKAVLPIVRRRAKGTVKN